MRLFKSLNNLAILLAMLTIVLGSYTRLTEAGLGCPDWPGCYGFIAVPAQAEQIAHAQQRFPGKIFESQKAHNEMLHRYLAGALGLCVVALYALSFWHKHNRFLSSIIFMLVILQAAFGMLTVTLNLLPLVVWGHLLGGFTLLSLLVLLRIKFSEKIPFKLEPSLFIFRSLSWVVLLLLLMQISLGVWTSSNYAALSCHQFPLCESGWQERFSLASALNLPMDKPSYQYGVMSADARMSIHVLHRLGALINFLAIGCFSYCIFRRAKTALFRGLAIGLACLLLLQVGLGIINVVSFLPLANAVAHTFFAASLLVVVTQIMYLLHVNARNKNYYQAHLYQGDISHQLDNEGTLWHRQRNGGI